VEAYIDSTPGTNADDGSSASGAAAKRRRPANRVSLLVRLWHDGSGGVCEPSQVRAFVRNLQSGEEQYLDGMDNVLGFVSATWATDKCSDKGSDNDFER
jgi:hypothetical protein